MVAAKLSICIPTYNRANFLDYLLGQFSDWDFGFSVEIVISDNGSTDTTQDVVAAHKARGLPITYFRRSENKGSMANYFTVLSRAGGEFLLYLADDDLIVPEAIRDTVRFLSNNPDIQAAYAPWQLFDDKAKVSSGLFYAVEGDRVFRHGEDLELLSYVIQRHIFPEIAIYRTAAAQQLICEGNFIFAHFLNFALVYALGPVAFLKQPFYRSVTNTPLRRQGDQAGIEHVMTQWDSYRGGLEFFVYRCMRRAGSPIQQEHKPVILSAIAAFLDVRMSVAQRLWLSRNEFVKAYEILCRRRFMSPDLVTAEAAQCGNLRQLVAFQTFARLANAIVDVTSVVVGDIAEVNVIEQTLRICGLEERIAVRAAPSSPTVADKHSSLVFLQHDASRGRYLAEGYLPGMIKSMENLSHIL